MVLGYVLAGGSSLLFIGLWALWGLLYHAWGFLQNNLKDYEHDKTDPSKQNFPLVKGVISFGRAQSIDAALFLVMMVLAVVLIVVRNGSLVGVLFLMAAIAFGELYNQKSKKSLWSPLWISLAFSSLPMISYFATTSQVGLPIVLLWAYVFFLMMWQISYSGYLKDILSDRVNLLRKLGMGVITSKQQGLVGLVSSRATEAYGWGLRLGTLVVGFWLLLLFSFQQWAVLTYLVLTFLVLAIVGTLVMVNVPWDHHKAVMRMALVEMLVYYMLIIAITGLTGFSWTLFLIVYPTAWFFVFNRLAWKTVVTPRV